MCSACLILAGCASPPPEPPRLIAGDSVHADLKALADDTWRQFLAVFEARSGCFGDVHLRAVYSLDERAGYNPETATVTVRVPATSAMLQGALVHEWAHHIEFQCEAQQALRPAFLAAQGLAADTPWRPDELAAPIAENTWASIPSEQFAEAAIVLVLGRRQISTGAHVSSQAVDVVAVWAAGGRDRP
jgi:hypothetical protein